MDKQKNNISRRDFLKSAATLTGAAVLTSSLPGISLAQEPVKIGGLWPLTGVFGPSGIPQRDGALVAMNRLEAEGGANGKPVELIVEDTAGKPEQAVRKMRKLVLKDNVDFLVGGLSSAVCLSLQPISERLKTIWLNTACTYSPKGCKRETKYHIRIANNARTQQKVLGPWALENVGKNWYALFYDYSWGWSEFQEFNRYVVEGKGNMVGYEAVPVGLEDMTPYLMKVDKEKVDGLFLVFSGEGAISIAKQSYQVGIHSPDVVRAGPAVLTSSYYLPAQGKAATGILGANRYPRVLEGKLDNEWNKAFHKEYKELSDGSIAGRFAIQGFRSINTLKHTIMGMNYKSKDQTCEAIEWLEDHTFEPGPDFPAGPIWIRPEDHQVFTDHYLQRVADGANQIVEIIDTFPMEEVLYPPECDLTEVQC